MSSAPSYHFHPLEMHQFGAVADGCDSPPPPHPPPQPPNWYPSPAEKTPSSSTFAFPRDGVKTDDGIWRPSAGAALSYDSGRDGLIQQGPPSPTDPASLQASYLQHKAARFAPAWIIAIFALGCSAATVFYSSRVMVNEAALPRVLQHTPGTTVAVINVLSHIVAFLCMTLFTDTMEALRWALACRPRGIPLTSFLAMSRATPITGVLYLCRVRGSHQMWAVQRCLSYVVTIMLSLVLITDVTFRTIYTPYTREVGPRSAAQNVVAGLAPVSSYGLTNISLALVPILATSFTLAFTTDPRFVTKVQAVECRGTDCLSVFLPGGMEAVRFYNQSGSQTLFNGDFGGDYDTIVISDAPGYQIEYGSIADINKTFQFDRSTRNGDCSMHFQMQDDGLYICYRQVGKKMFLGWTICSDGIYQQKRCQEDLSWTDDIMWNTTVSMYSRRATVAYDRQNVSIISIESLSAPQEIQVNTDAFGVYSQVVMGPISPVLNFTKDPETYALSATMFGFGYGAGFQLRLFRSDYSTYLDGGLSLLRSFVAVPFQFSTAIRQYGGVDMMPAENHVTAYLSKAWYRAFIEPWTVWVFGFLSIIFTTWCLIALTWISFFAPYTPNLSHFPEINITSKSSLHTHQTVGTDLDPHLETANMTLEDLGRLTRSYGLGNGLSHTVIDSIRGKRVFCGSLPGSNQGERIIVLVTEGGRLKMLNKYERYS